MACAHLVATTVFLGCLPVVGAPITATPPLDLSLVQHKKEQKQFLRKAYEGPKNPLSPHPSGT